MESRLMIEAEEMTHSPLRTTVNDGQVKELAGVGPDKKVAGAGIEIAGPVEERAKVLAEGDVRVSASVGKDASIVAVGSVEVASVDGGEIVAREDVFIRTTAIGSRIRGGGTVVIGEDGLPGKVEGGTAHGVMGIVVNGPIVGGATLGIEADKN